MKVTMRCFISLPGHLTYICMPLRQVPIGSMQHVLAANKKRLIQGCKNAVAHLRRATKNVECANVFFAFYTSCI